MVGSHFDDPNQWRLRSNNGVVPFKLVQQDGSFEMESASWSITSFVPTVDLYAFLVETFPAPIPVGNVVVQQGSSLPGLPALQAKRVTVKSQDPSKPIDPFGFDSGAPAGTYHPIAEVTVEYGASPRTSNPSADDPRTFLEISSSGSGQFLHIDTTAAKIEEETPNPANPDDATEPPKTNVPIEPNTKGVKKSVRSPNLPTNIIVPQVEWTMKWPQIPYNYFHDTLSYRIRWCLGCVNNAVFPLFFNASYETVLFSGWSHNESYTWRNGQIGAPPISLELKFVEKRLMWKGKLVGHNHFWSPSSGWEYLLIDGVRPVYQPKNLMIMFKV